MSNKAARLLCDRLFRVAAGQYCSMTVLDVAHAMYIDAKHTIPRTFVVSIPHHTGRSC
jgi:hypothetical protein